VASGFIAQIVVGNLWLTYWYFGNLPPRGVSIAFEAATAIVIFGALGLAWERISGTSKPQEARQDDHDG
jgi:hypothetical protein